MVVIVIVIVRKGCLTRICPFLDGDTVVLHTTTVTFLLLLEHLVWFCERNKESLLQQYCIISVLKGLD